jgi:hypothetical protein
VTAATLPQERQRALAAPRSRLQPGQKPMPNFVTSSRGRRRGGTAGPFRRSLSQSSNIASLLPQRVKQPRPLIFVGVHHRFWEQVMPRISYLALCAALALATAGCGDTPGERALTGGAIGAGGGALVGAATGNVAAGAIVGGLGGAAIGAATTPRRYYY